MNGRLLRPGAAWCAILLAVGLIAGCGGTAGSVVGVTTPTSGPITEGASRCVCARRQPATGDMPGFTGIESETEAPEPGRYGLDTSAAVVGSTPPAGSPRSTRRNSRQDAPFTARSEIHRRSLADAVPSRFQQHHIPQLPRPSVLRAFPRRGPSTDQSGTQRANANRAIHDHLRGQPIARGQP